MSIPESLAKRSSQITRSPLVFWLGLFGLFFIFWSWIHSMTRMAGLGRQLEIQELHPSKSSVWIHRSRYMAFYGHSFGYLRVSIPICKPTGALRVDTIKYEPWSSSDVPADAEPFPMPRIKQEKAMTFPSGASYVGTSFLFPHWNLVIIYLSIWAGLMDWSNKRARRAARAAQQVDL